MTSRRAGSGEGKLAKKAVDNSILDQLRRVPVLTCLEALAYIFKVVRFSDMLRVEPSAEMDGNSVPLSCARNVYDTSFSGAT